MRFTQATECLLVIKHRGLRCDFIARILQTQLFDYISDVASIDEAIECLKSHKDISLIVFDWSLYGVTGDADSFSQLMIQVTNLKDQLVPIMVVVPPQFSFEAAKFLCEFGANGLFSLMERDALDPSCVEALDFALRELLQKRMAITSWEYLIQ